jgi:hypothetical protein
MWGNQLKRKHRLASATNFVLEALESRQLLSASLTSAVDGMYLNVRGTGRGDEISVGISAFDANLIDVTVNKVTQSFDRTGVTKITIDGRGGNDSIAIDEVHGVLPVGVSILGGKGRDNLRGSRLNDTIIGGAGDDYLMGKAGDDSLLGGKGKDFLWGDAGNDFMSGDKDRDNLYGGDGDDHMLGGVGNDLISSGAGNNVTDGGAGSNHIDDAWAKGFSLPSKLKSLGTNAVNGSPTGLTADEVRRAYGVDTLGSMGDAQAIAVVIWGHNPTASQDLAAFSFQFGLPTPTPQSFQYVFASGTQPPDDLDAAGESALDIQWAHAMAPNAKIYLVEAAAASFPETLQAIQVAAETLRANHGGGVVNMSFGSQDGSEIDPATYEPVLNDPRFRTVSFTASSGDTGGEITYPSTSGRVLSVGGTSLFLDGSGNRLSESAWDEGGGGPSQIIPTPPYQIGLTEGGNPVGNFRVTPDVSAVADPATGVSVYTSFDPGDGDTGWHTFGGTSASAPIWAGLVALVNQRRAAGGLNLIGDGLTSKIYGLAQSGQGTYFNDITTGSNSFPAQVGYDQATGWGTPKSATLIPALADASSFNTGVRDFTWNAEYKEALQKYPGGNVGPLFADFRGTGIANIGLTALSLSFSIVQEFNGSLLQITAANLGRASDGHFFGTGSATVSGPLTGNLFTLSIAGFVNTDSHGELQVKGSFTGLNSITGQEPVKGAEEQFSGLFSTH